MVPYFKKNEFDDGMLNGYKAFYQEISDYYDISTDIKPIKKSSSPIENAIAYLFIFKLFISFVILFIDLSLSRHKTTVFVFLEVMTIIISFFGFNAGFNTSQLTLFGVGTLINLAVVNFTMNSFGGRYYGGSRIGTHFSSGGHSGGGGSTNGSGSTRKF